HGPRDPRASSAEPVKRAEAGGRTVSAGGAASGWIQAGDRRPESTRGRSRSSCRPARWAQWGGRDLGGGEDDLDGYGFALGGEREQGADDPLAVDAGARAFGDARVERAGPADGDLVGRAAEAAGGGEARPGGRDYRVDPQAVELGPDAEDPLGDGDEVPGGG